MQNLYKDLEVILQEDQSLISEGRILKNAVIERAAKMDGDFIRLLVRSERIRDHFFTDVDGILVFDKAKFQNFVSNKQFLPDSYTSYRNIVGLSDGRNHLKDSRDIVLAWPYKDCVLEGEQTTENEERQEVFWNTTLAPDDISRLFEPKAMTGFERWDVKAAEEGQPKSLKEINLDDNLLINGNNLLALHSLKVRYAEKVKLIYIDPPYNTGKDAFRYNDRFNHSAWLTFMKNRLEVAKELLTRDGIILISIDERESAYLRVLMDEIFGRENSCNSFVWEKKRKPSFLNANMGVVTEQIIAFARNREYSPAFQFGVTEKGKKTPLNNAGNNISTLRFPKGTINFGIPDQSLSPKDMSEGNVITRLLNSFSIKDGVNDRDVLLEGEWRYGQEKLDEVIKSGDEIWIAKVPFRPNHIKSEVSAKKMKNLLSRAQYGMSTYEDATTELENLFSGVNNFEYAKPEKLIYTLIEAITNPGDLVMDFFAGSGTTAAVAHKLGRQWIAVEQMEYIRDLTATRVKEVIKGEQGGISTSVEWKGGGSFVYAELASWNAILADEIHSAKDSSALGSLRDRLRTHGYVRPEIKLDSLDNAEFDALSLDDQKRVLMECLDANHLYVNYSEMADEEYGVSEEEIRVNRAFYGDEV